jgi:hypothetical protein
LLDVKKFIGKAGYVSDQLGIRAQSYSDPEKFIGKAGYVVAQLAIHAQDYSDPEKFIGKSKFVGQQITVQVYYAFNSNQPTLLVLLLPLAGFVIIRAENQNIRFYHIQKIVSFLFIIILLSSSIIGPFSYSFILWGNAFAQEADPLGEGIGPPDEPPLVNQLAQTVEEVLEKIIEDPPPVVKELPPTAPVVVKSPPIEPIANVTTIEPIANSTSNEPMEQPDTDPTGDKHTTVFDETLVLADDAIIIPEYTEIISDESIILQTNNQTILFNETIILNDNSTVEYNLLIISIQN